MQDFQRDFLDFALAQGIIRFGEFTLKSGRSSPYFFNSGLFNTGASLRRVGESYAAAIMHANVAFDALFGPAYKGIPLVAATAIALAACFDRSVPYCFDRKEAKDHGEGGFIVGAPPRGRVLIVDDVISAGASVNHSVEVIRNAGAVPAGVVIALDRQERGQASQCSAVAEVEQRFNIPVIAIVRLEHMLRYLEGQPGMSTALASIMSYKDRYGAEAT